MKVRNKKKKKSPNRLRTFSSCNERAQDKMLVPTKCWSYQNTPHRHLLLITCTKGPLLSCTNGVLCVPDKYFFWLSEWVDYRHQGKTCAIYTITIFCQPTMSFTLNTVPWAIQIFFFPWMNQKISGKGLFNFETRNFPGLVGWNFSSGPVIGG